MIKILFIHHATGLGGAPLNMINIIRCLDKEKYSCHVLLIKESEVTEQLKLYNIPYSIAQSLFYKRIYSYFIHSEANYVKWYQPIRFCKLAIFWILSRYYFADRELKKHNYDIIHLNSSVLTDWMASAKKRGKVVINIQEPFRKGHCDFLHFYFRKQYLKNSDRIIAISQDNARRVNLLPKTDIVYNFIYPFKECIDTESIDSKSVMYLGGAQRIKGFYTIVDALKFLDKDVRVFFGGYYKSMDASKAGLKVFIKRIFGINRELTDYISRLYSSKNSFILGYIEDTSEYYRKICCLVSPFSIPHFSRPIIESYLHHKPVIATNIEGIDEIVIDGVTGILVKRNDPLELANAINYLTSNPLIAHKMGLKGYEFAIDKFTDSNIGQYESIYINLVKSK